MTKITVFRNRGGEYLGFDCLGHAGYAEAGYDIVCAGISVLVINFINSVDSRFFVGYPLFFLNSYIGYFSCNSSNILSLVTFAITLAALIVILFHYS